MGDRLTGKVAIVVGAGQTPGETVGNGRAIALRFAREGARVLCVDRDLERAEETAALVVGEGGEARAHRADIAVSDDCAAIVATCLARFGGLDVLVNNVGIAGAFDAPAHRLEEAAWDRVFAVNLKGAWLTIKAAIPELRRRSGGSIVNISSMAAITGGGQTAYEVSKAGMNRLTTNVAMTNARYGLRCNAIMPGLMDTPMAIVTYAEATGQAPDAIRQARNARVPLSGHMGSGWDTANAALFLASDEAAFVTGVILPVDGGMSIRIG